MITEDMEKVYKEGEAEGETSAIRKTAHSFKKLFSKADAIKHLMETFNLSEKDATKYYTAA